MVTRRREEAVGGGFGFWRYRCGCDVDIYGRYDIDALLYLSLL